MTTRPQDAGDNTDEVGDDDESGQTDSQTASGAGTAEAESDEEWQPERAKSTITTLREREKALDKRAREAERALKALQDASKTEQERKDAELEELRALKTKYESERREQTTRAVFLKEAQRQGASRPEALFRLAEGLELDEDGTPTNAPSVLKELKKDYPEMFGAGGGSADGGAGRGQSPSAPTMNDMIRSKMRGG